MIERISEDIEISHAGGSSTVKGLPVGDVKEFRNRAKESVDGRASLTFRGVRRIDILRPDGTPDQTILGEPKPAE